MSDSKLSELTAATSVAADDTHYLVQGGSSKKVSTANIFGQISTPTLFADKVSIGDHINVTSAGVLSNDYNVHLIVDPAVGGTLTLTGGTTGQLKTIIMTSNASAVTLLLDDSDLGHDTITFDSAGDTALLIYAGSKWWMVGGSAAVT
jgi:phosphoserine phosphatase